MLELENISTFYGNVQALRDVTMNVKEKEIVTIIGSNGAGKSTLLRTIINSVQPRKGSVYFNGLRIDGSTTKNCVVLGISLVPEGRQIFPNLTVGENLQLGAHLRYGRRELREIKDDFDLIFSIFPILAERAKQRAGTLSGGEQQMLAIGRALMSRPKLLLLDEPSLGLAPKVIRDIFRVLRVLNERGLTILLVEQDAKIALSLADRGYVLQNGGIALTDSGARLIANPMVKQIYFGKAV